MSSAGIKVHLGLVNNHPEHICLMQKKASLALLFYCSLSLQTIVELAETGCLDLSIFCSTCLVIMTFQFCLYTFSTSRLVERWLADNPTVWFALQFPSRCTHFNGLYSTDTEAHQIETLRRVQSMHRQVWSPLPLGRQLRRWVFQGQIFHHFPHRPSPTSHALIWKVRDCSGHSLLILKKRLFFASCNTNLIFLLVLIWVKDRIRKGM